MKNSKDNNAKTAKSASPKLDAKLLEKKLDNLSKIQKEQEKKINEKDKATKVAQKNINEILTTVKTLQSNTAKVLKTRPSSLPTTRPVSRATTQSVQKSSSRPVSRTITRPASKPGSTPVSRVVTRPNSRGSVASNGSRNGWLDSYRNSDRYIELKTQQYTVIPAGKFNTIQIGDNIRYKRSDGGFRLGGTVIEITQSKKYNDMFFRLQFTSKKGTIFFNIFWKRIGVLWRQTNIENDILKEMLNTKQFYINYLVDFLYMKYGEEFRNFMRDKMRKKN